MKRLFKNTLFPFIATLSLCLFSCSNTNTASDYYYKEYVNNNGINIEFYGKGYGNYGQLLPNYCEGNIINILDNENQITIKSSGTDNSSATTNEIYITLTLNRHCESLITEFETPDTTLLSGFRISYKDYEGNEKSVTSSYKNKSEYKIGTEVSTLSLSFKQNKYYSSSHKDEDKRNKLANNPFTIKKIIPQ